MRKTKTITLALLLIAMMAFFITGCSKYEALDKGIEGEISVMLWSGSGKFMEDVGHQDLTPADSTGQNEAAVYAMAKKFNETYPNIKIKVYAKVGGPHDNERPWAQELENLKAEHGKYPDIYASTDLSGDVARGLVADLSVFEDSMRK